MMITSRHQEIRLSLSQLCGVNKKKPPLQSLNSGQFAPHSLGAEKLPPNHRVHSIEAWLHRGAAMMPQTAPQKRPHRAG